MLTKTFVHIPGIGPTTEQHYWSLGVDDWDTALAGLPEELPARCRRTLPTAIQESRQALTQGDSRYFATRLQSKYQWRLYPQFQNSVAFFDIETTGLSEHADHITTIALFDGRTIRTYLHGENLDDFAEDIERYQLLVTYNGKCFDVPFVRRQLPGLKLDQAHVDLRYVLRSLGYSGGLKRCEQQMHLPRTPGLEQVDGFMAVKLWWAHEAGDPRALPALLRYNIEDAVNLQWLMQTAYNLAAAQQPIPVDRITVAPRPKVDLPFDPTIIHELA